MKALVFEKPDNPQIVDVPMPAIKDTEVLIKSRTIGICHSDYELLGGRYIIPISYPVTPGHEWCGEIVEVGKSVKKFKLGDRVVGECVVRTPERLHADPAQGRLTMNAFFTCRRNATSGAPAP